MSFLLGWVLKLLGSSAVDKALGYLERKADTETEREKIRTQATIEQIRAATEETRIMADLNRAKLEFPWFWVMVATFVLPLAMWWTAILFDSMFHFGWGISDLPTPELKAMASDMVKWLFYTGTTGAVAKMVLR